MKASDFYKEGWKEQPPKYIYFGENCSFSKFEIKTKTKEEWKILTKKTRNLPR